TNMDLEAGIESGKFRADLYYRLNVLPIEIPPLRFRKGDIYDLSTFFIKKFNQQYGRNVRDISQEAVNKLKEYNWPGNVRELENIIGRAIINMRINDTVIQESHLPHFERLAGKEGSIVVNDQINEEASMTLENAVEKAEKMHIEQVMKQCGDNKTKAAKVMNISLRSLYYKLEKYDLQ
nr:helix-turn-helix domain-containing protein [Bacillota bacterium]